VSAHAIDARTASAGTSRLPLVSVLVAALGFAAVAIFFAVRKHDAILSGYDLALTDQELWLLAHGHTPQNTLDGRLMWGEHLNITLALLAPLWALGAGAKTLLVLQALAMAAVGPLLFLLARAHGAGAWLATLPAFVWLASPLTLAACLEDVHHAPLVAPAIVGSIVALARGRLVVFAVLALVASLAKEDISLMYVMLGVVLALEGRRRLGAAIGAAALAVFVFAVAIFMPAFGDSASYYAKRFAGDRGDSIGSTLVWMLGHPASAAGDLFTAQNVSICLVLLLTCGGLCLLAPRWMLLGLPALAHNLLSAYEPQHQLGRQYYVPVTIALAIAGAVGVRRLPELGKVTRLALAAGVTAALVSTVVGVSSAKIGSEWTRGEIANAGGVPVRRAALALIPDDVPVVASPRLAAHLSHRREIYALPLPFLGRRRFVTDWSPNEVERRARGVRWIALDTGDRPTEFQDAPERLLPLLPDLGFRAVYREGSVIVFRR
jgi:uncharacterized membrane protein